jgi:hypothetical protein
MSKTNTYTIDGASGPLHVTPAHGVGVHGSTSRLSQSCHPLRLSVQPGPLVAVYKLTSPSLSSALTGVYDTLQSEMAVLGKEALVEPKGHNVHVPAPAALNLPVGHTTAVALGDPAGHA